MSRLGFFCFCVILLGGGSLLKGQSQDNKTTFATSDELKYALNPGGILLDRNFELTSVYQNYVGEFSAVRTLFLAGATRLKENHKLWFELYSNQEGPYFSKNRFYAGYSPEIQLNPRWQMSLGATIGVLQYQFKSSSGGAGGSDIKVDGSAGMVLKEEKMQFGLSYQQFTNSTISPLETAYRTAAYFDVFVQYELEWSREWRSVVMLRANNQSEEVGGALFWSNYYKEWAMLGFNFDTDKVLSFKGGVTLAPRHEKQVDLTFAYRIPFEALINTSQVEIGFVFYSNK